MDAQPGSVWPVSTSNGPQNGLQYTMILMVRTPTLGPLIFGSSHFLVLEVLLAGECSGEVCSRSLSCYPGLAWATVYLQFGSLNPSSRSYNLLICMRVLFLGAESRFQDLRQLAGLSPL